MAPDLASTRAAIDAALTEADAAIVADAAREAAQAQTVADLQTALSAAQGALTTAQGERDAARQRLADVVAKLQIAKTDDANADQHRDEAIVIAQG